MADLTATTPGADLLPLEIGATTFAELPGTPIWSLSPWPGSEAALAGALGTDLPPPGHSTPLGAATLASSALHEWLLIGAAPDPALAAHAALTDQSDAWTRLHLAGPLAEPALARLTPIDIRATAFPPGRIARSLLGHMNALFVRAPDSAFHIMTMRSMATDTVHDLRTALRSADARTR